MLVRHEVALDPAHLVSLRNRLDAALAEEGYGGRRMQDGSPKSEAYIPRNPTLSQLQSLVANRLTLDAPVELTRDPDFSARPDNNIDRNSDLDPVTSVSVADRLDDALGELKRETL